MILSIIVPVYKEERNIPEFLKRILPIAKKETTEFEIIFTMDPSPDNTESVILSHHKEDSRIKLLKFSRRIGQPMATLAGLQYSSGDAVIVMDVDMQDPPELIPQMMTRWREGYDVVMAQRRSRDGETLLKKWVSIVGYRLINWVAEAPIPPNTGDFRLMSRRVVNEINRLKECHGFLRGLVAIVGFKQTSILFDRPPRFQGFGNYNRFLGSIRIGLNGLVCFSSSLLSMISKMGFIVALLSFLMGLAQIILKFTNSTVPLNSPFWVTVVFFMGGIQLLSLGILGEYIARIYDEVKQRPKFIIDQAIGFES